MSIPGHDDSQQWLCEARRVLVEAAAALTAMKERLDPEAWAGAMRLLLSARGRVVVLGMGKSGAVARKLAGTLSSTGTPALFLHPAEGAHGDLGMLAPEDVVIALSYSGETDEILALLPAIAHLRVPLIALTGRPHSTLGRAAAAVLDVSVDREACPMNLAPTTSTTAMIALGDALAVSLMVARRFTEHDYARLHPAGTLGRRLTLRVADLMRTGDAVAVVPETASVFDALFAITQAHAGAAIIVDDAGRVAGLIADGDIRRHLLLDRDILARPARDVMTRRPGLVSPDLLAVEGLRLLEEFHPDPGTSVGEAPVVDAEGRPLGMLMLKDFVKTGIV
ncbi:MAG: KpsF/GutQ family sugar-phosphate isomerase [Armatimonadetes bacterium]|nr:KpsF/GutQ family sugar-phosphate isomerase [Armatimonadota bacterium]